MFLQMMFQDYWNLYHKVTFDGINRLIIVNQGVTEIDVQRDIYSSWKEWSLVDLNARFYQAISTVGGEPTVAGQFLDVTYFLINGWRLKPYSGSYTLNIIGNIFEIDGNPIFVSANILPDITNNININTNTSVIVRKISGDGGTTDLTEVNDKLDTQYSKLVSIENRVISIQNILSAPIEAYLASSDASKLNEILSKVTDIWNSDNSGLR